MHNDPRRWAMRGGCRLNITTCGNYPRACVMPERYFVFTCCSADVSISASIRKRKNFDSCVSASFAVVLASLAIENQAFEFSPRPSSFLEKYRLQVVHLKAKRLQARNWNKSSTTEPSLTISAIFSPEYHRKTLPTSFNTFDVQPPRHHGHFILARTKAHSVTLLCS